MEGRAPKPQVRATCSLWTHVVLSAAAERKVRVPLRYPLPTEEQIQKWWGKNATLADVIPKSGTILPGQSVRVSGVMVAITEQSNTTRWFNNTGVDVIPIRYSIKLRGTDFVFPWLAPAYTEFAAVPQWDY